MPPKRDRRRAKLTEPRNGALMATKFQSHLLAPHRSGKATLECCARVTKWKREANFVPGGNGLGGAAIFYLEKVSGTKQDGGDSKWTRPHSLNYLRDLPDNFSCLPKWNKIQKQNFCFYIRVLTILIWSYIDLVPYFFVVVEFKKCNSYYHKHSFATNCTLSSNLHRTNLDKTSLFMVATSLVHSTYV